MKLRIFALLACAAAWASNVSAGCPTQPAQLVAPANGAANVASPVRFDWNEVSSGDSYRLWASFNGGTPNIIALTTDSEYTVNVPAGPVDWWVDALGDNCPTPTTSVHFHFTAAGGTATCPQNPTSPTLLTPAAGASNLASPVTLTWTSVSGSSGYRVFASVNGSAAALLGSTSLTQLSVPFPQGNVIWFVEAQFMNCPSTFSRFGSFVVAVGAPCSTTPTTLIAPANGATVAATSPITLQWNRVAGAIGYKVYVGSDLVGITTDNTLTRLVGAGTVTWRVDTMFVGCPDVPSSAFTFTVAAANTCSGSVSLLTPAENSTVTSPASLAWTPVAKATAYRVWASFDGSSPTILARTSTTSQSLNTPSGNVTWFVEALFASCPSILSAQGHFIVGQGAGCSSNKPAVLTSPINGTQAQSPVDFTWNAANGAMLYRIWVSVNGGPFDDVGITKGTDLKTDVAGGNIQWFVETFFNGCQSVNSAPAGFTIQQPPGCANSTTILISPGDNANTTAPVTLAWSAVANADDYRVFATFNGSAPTLIGRTKDTSLTKNLPPGSIAWWVETTFDSCPSTKSIRSHFVVPRAANCGTDVPQLVTPADGANNVTSPVKLDWNPVSGAVAYAVFVRHNGGSPTAIGETTNTALTKRLPEGAFEWFVVAFFAGCPPAASAHATFSIPVTTCSNRQPILRAPADGATALTSPVHFEWTPVPKATSYKVWAAIDDDEASVLTTTTSNKATLDMPAGAIGWYVEAIFAGCPSVTSATSSFAVRKSAPACKTPDKPVARVAGQVASGTPFTIQWNAVANATNYELQESATLNFNNATTTLISDVSTTLTRTAATQPVRYFFRVRADSNCSDDHSAYSKIVSVVVAPLQTGSTTVDVGVQNGVMQQIVLAGQNPPVTFSAHGDKPWITVSPASGTVGPQGATLTVSFDPSALKLGTNMGTVLVTYGASGPIRADGVAPVIPVSVSLVTPVAPGGKNAPPPDSLIIPAVGHAPGVNNSMFESDVRVANTSAQTQKYQLNFTLSKTDGTQSGQSSTIEINPGDTMALDDILSNYFGIGTDGGSATGVLEIRPLTPVTNSLTSTTPSIQTVASSRTFTTSANGTYGQFIPAIPFSQFIGQGSRVSLQQVAQSAAYRTNIGLVEAAGEPATVLLHVFDDTGNEVTTIPESLLPSEHLQLNGILPAVTDGRVEVEVTSSTGKVTAYASVVDNVTNDPLLVSPVLKGSVSNTRYVIPGVADLNTGVASWRSDLRFFNSGTAPVTATLSYFPQPGNQGASKTAQLTIAPGEVKAIDSAMQSLYGLSDTGGSILVTTAATSGLVVTGRTYNQTANGTFGQFIPAVTPAQGVGNGDAALQVLQLEESNNFYTNFGLAELTGNPAHVRMTAYIPDSKVSVTTDFDIAPNQFIQFNHLLASFGFSQSSIYNARIAVSVTSGTGRVTAYGSVVDQTTKDPTYVPAQ